MKEKIKNFYKKYKLFIIIGIVFILLIILALIFIFSYPKKETSNKGNKVEETYTMYVKINPLVKLTFKEEYKTCDDGQGKQIVCSEIINEVTDFELLNDDAKEFYHSLDFKGKTISEALVSLCDIAKDNDVLFEKLEITSDSKHLDKEKLMNYLKDNAKYDVDFTLYIHFKEHMNDEDFNENGEVKFYTITFNTDGGSTIEPQKINKGEKATATTSPTKDGYTFKEWQYNGQKFSFDEEITEDIELIAIWEKIEDKKEETNPEETKPEENNDPNPKEEEKEEEYPYDINLNDNVLYTTTGTSSKDFVSWKFKEVCFNKTIAELKQFDPNHNQSYLEDLSDMYNDDTLITKKDFLGGNETYTLLQMFPGCQDVIPESYRNLFDNIKGWSFLSIENNALYVRYIELDERYSWSSYHQELDLSPYNLSIPNPYSGGGTPPTPEILTEEVCTEYHLSCGRW